MAVIPQKPHSFKLIRTHPSVRNLVFDMPFYERGGFNPIDLISKKHGLLDSGASWLIGKIGPGISLTGSSSKKMAFTAPGYVNGLVNQTVQIIFKSPASYVDGETLFNKGQEGTSASGRYFMAGESSTGLNAFVIVSAHASQNGVWTYPFPSVSEVHNTIITYNNAAGNVPRVFQDGTPQSVGTILAATGAVNADTPDLTIGNKYSGNNSWSRDIYLVRVWNRVLTDAEITKLSQNPWGIYKKSDFVGKVPSGTTYTQTLTDVLTLVDTVIKTPSKFLADVVALVDTLVKSPTKTLADAIILVDTVIKNPVKVLTDVVTLVDVFTGKIIARILSEAVTLVDTGIKTTSRTLTDIVALVDTVLKTPGKLLTDAVSLADTLIKNPTKVLTEVVTLVDGIIRAISRTLTDVVTLVDTLITSLFNGLIYTKELLESITLVDTVVKGGQKVLTDSITLKDWVWQKWVKAAITWTQQTASSVSWTKQTPTDTDWEQERGNAS